MCYYVVYKRRFVESVYKNEKFSVVCENCKYNEGMEIGEFSTITDAYYYYYYLLYI
jgi:hypothetical protein